MASATPAISVANLGKQYSLGPSSRPRPYRSLRETVASAPARLLRRQTRGTCDFWALRGVSFDVPVGERVGVVGRNGAGKSTLLKLLARITKPTEGRAQVRGRVGSLLEVGSGFHLELTGRENIYLNGAILGMSRREITSKIDDIVSFAGVERFLDVPVKRYSTGMHLRLAFAVAAHLEPEVLLVDEVLAVGDAEFQKKCIGRMEELGRQGRTVIFVSHSMGAIVRLCDRVILIDQGAVLADGPSREVVSRYLAAGLASPAERTWSEPDMAPGGDLVRLKGVRVLAGGRVQDDIEIRCPVDIEVEYWQLRDPGILRPAVLLKIVNHEGLVLFATSNWGDAAWAEGPRTQGIIRTTCRIPGNFLAEGRHYVHAEIRTYNPIDVHFYVPDAISFDVVDRGDGDSVRGPAAHEWPGVIRPMFEWRMEQLTAPRIMAAVS